MQALLLAGGYGTRLKPITDTVPKCLVPINGKPLLEYWLEDLSSAGVTRFHINTHYLAEQVEAFVKTQRDKYHITTYFEPQLLGTYKTLQHIAQQVWHRDELLVAHADNLVFANWRAFLQQPLNEVDGVLGSLMTFDTDTPSACGIVETDAQKRLVAFHEKVANPPSNRASGAIYRFDHQITQYFSSNEDETDISYHLIPKLLGKLVCWHNDDYLRDIGTPESLAQAEYDVKNRCIGVLEHDKV